MRIAHPIKMVAVAGLVTVLAAVSARAGQVITPEQKQWAGQAVQQEKRLAAMTKPNTIAVLNFRNLSEDRSLDPLQKGLTVMLISDLAKLDTITVVERTELQALVEELGFGQSGLVDPASAPRVGRLLQSQYLVGGAFSGKAATGITADAQLIDVAPGKTVGSADAAGQLPALFAIEKQLLNQIVQALHLNLTASQLQAINAPMSRHTGALMNLFKGIDANDRRQYDAAASYFHLAIRQDPSLTLARTSLQELRTLNLVPPPKVSAAAGTARDTDEEQALSLEKRRSLLRRARQRTSLTTTLHPPTPLSRIPNPAAVQPAQPDEPTYDVFNRTGAFDNN